MCGKFGQEALRCYHRFDHSYQAEESAHVAVAVSTSYNIDRNWYADMGVTDHLTIDLDRLTMHELYNGSDKIQVANGSGMTISHVGQSAVPRSFCSFILNNVLHVPCVNKNLVSVHKFTRDNYAFTLSCPEAGIYIKLMYKMLFYMEFFKKMFTCINRRVMKIVDILDIFVNLKILSMG